jgi:uncharacterized membrane protein YheB (UPF0754 family)
LNYISPNLQEITWKKSTPEQSLQNLQEISTFVLNLLSGPEIINNKNLLSNSIFTNQVDEIFTNMVNFFETEIKTWLSQNQKSTGDYLWPLRVALSGKQKSPSPFELLTVLSIQMINDRLQSFLN